MAREKFIDKISRYYLENDTGSLTSTEKKRKVRLDYIIELKLNDFAISDKRILTLVKKNYSISPGTILSDITIAERIIVGKKSNSIDLEKSWIRYFISEAAKESYRIAREKKDAYSMIQAANIIGKHHNTDKEDVYSDLFDEIVPFTPEITIDPSILGIKKMKNLDEIKAKLLKKYTAIDIDYEEIVPKKEKEILPK